MSAHSLRADDFQPLIVKLYLHESNAVQSQEYRLDLKVPSDTRLTSLPRLLMPKNCKKQSLSTTVIEDKASKIIDQYSCASSLHGQQLKVFYPSGNPGLSTFISVDHGDSNVVSAMLAPHQLSWTVPNKSNASAVSLQYFKLGVTHLLSGYDHLLFIACLIFICSGSLRKLFITITAFTLSHSVSLGITILTKLSLFMPAVEAVISLSIAYLAYDIVKRLRSDADKQNREFSLSYQYPAAVAGIFGLLHGLGFSNVLAEFGLPHNHKIAALLSFNIGIEIGQLLFVIALLLLARLLSKLIPSIRHSKIERGDASRVLELRLVSRIAVMVVYAIGGLSMFWTVERVVAAI